MPRDDRKTLKTHGIKIEFEPLKWWLYRQKWGEISQTVRCP